MKNNKLLCILLSIAMLLALCACGSSPAPSGTQTVTEGPSVSGTTTTPEPVAEPEPEPEAEPEAEPEEEFSVGATVSNTYTNEFFGLGLTLDENWVFSTQEEIDATNAAVMEGLDNETYSQAMESGAVYTDMMALGAGGAGVNATIEKLNAVMGLALTEEDYVDLSLEQNDFKALYAQMGLDVSVLEKETVTVAGAEHPCIVIEGTMQGIALYEKIVVIKSGSYVLSIAASSYIEDVTDGILELFYAV